MTETKRLKELMNLLHYKTQNDFAKALEIQPGTLSNLLGETKSTKVSTRIKNRLSDFLNVNMDWFRTGNGDPFKIGASVEKAGGVPYFATDVPSLAMDVPPQYFINYKPFNDCAAYINVYGDNMYPKYASGEVIAIKEITNYYGIIQWGESYVIETDEETNAFRGIRQIHQHTNDNKLILRSSNPNFRGDVVIERRNVTKLYIIKGKITKNLL